MDKAGHDKTNLRHLYSSARGCISVNLRYDEYSDHNGLQRMYLDFVQDEDGNWVNRSIHTSPVYKVRTTEIGIDVHTHCSVYVLEKTKLKEVSNYSNKNTIELYLSLDEKYNFAKGFYWDNDGNSRELKATIHIGMLTDTILVGFSDKDAKGNYVCRYYLNDWSIDFYDTLYLFLSHTAPILD